MNQNKKLQELAKLIRYYILISSTEAASGHPTSSLSAVELMTVLAFDGFLRYDTKNPHNPNNDRLIFSKGHASPLFYGLFAAAGEVTEKEMLAFRKFTSNLEGHPTLTFPYTQATTGSLGQGLSVGIGMALNAKYIDKSPLKAYVLMGDSEMAEGSVWESMQIATHYKLDNLVGIIDVNRLGQSTETMAGHDIQSYKKKAEAFGWEAITADGHSLTQIQKAFAKAMKVKDKPVMIIAKTMKGHGVSFLDNKENCHGKPLNKEQLQAALSELGTINKKIRGIMKKPTLGKPVRQKSSAIKLPSYNKTDLLPTRKGYGNGLARIFPKFPEMVVLDAETSNSTFSEVFKAAYPKNYFEMYIAEQNMVGTALGLSRMGKIPFVSTFGAFFSRAFDQIRMSQYSDANIKFMGSHVGVSIGEDGASQMGLEDIAMFRSIRESVVLYPSDAVAADKLTEEAAAYRGIVYIRGTRNPSPIIYANDETFPIGGSKTLKSSKKDVVTVVAAGVTLQETLKAYDELKKDGVAIRVIDLYSIKPLDVKTLIKAAKETKAIITVEDHHEAGGIGEAVKSSLYGNTTPIISLAVRKMPHSGKPQELLDFEEISTNAIVKQVKKLI